MSLIYKILPKADFEAAIAEGFFSGAGIGGCQAAGLPATAIEAR